MNKKIKNITTATLTIICCSTLKAESAELFGLSFFSPRSQGSNSARHLVGQHPYMNKKEATSCYGTLSATVEYLHAFKTRRIAEYFFGCDTIRFSGSQVTTRQDGDLLADYFGLSPSFDSEMFIKPNMQTTLVDFNLYCGLDGLCTGLYLFAYAPFAWTRSRICLEEEITNNGSDTQFPADYMQATALSAPVTSALQPFEGNVTFGQVTQGINYGKFGPYVDDKKVADVQFGLGWNFIRREHGHFGVHVHASAPTGTRPTSEYLFEPIIGNGRHWECGIGFSGDILLWEKDDEQTINFNIIANFTHLFKARQCRSFDFTTNGFGSRYMLLKEFDTDHTYTENMLPAINKTTLPCDVRVDLKIDGTFMASYHDQHWTFDVGYNGFIRTREKICIIGTIEENKYGLKGIQNVTNIDANKTESSATLHGNDITQRDQVADNPSPVFIKTSDLDPCSAAMPRYISHKFFWHLSHAWSEDEGQFFVPYLGVGMEVEFEGVKIKESRPNKNTLSLFGIWAKGGLAF